MWIFINRNYYSTILYTNVFIMSCLHSFLFSAALDRKYHWHHSKSILVNESSHLGALPYTLNGWPGPPKLAGLPNVHLICMPTFMRL